MRNRTEDWNKILNNLDHYKLDDASNACIEWHGSLDAMHKVEQSLMRRIYVKDNGPIPNNVLIYNECDICCINPRHMKMK